MSKTSKPSLRDYHSVDDDEINRLIANGALTKEEGRRLLINFHDEQVIMLAVGEDGTVYADITSEHYAIKKYGREKVIGPSVK